MKQRPQLSKQIIAAVSFAVALTAMAAPALANKLVLSGGAFSFSAENASNRRTASVSGFGSYQLAYRYRLLQVFELDLGYSLLSTEVVGGDLSFGFDIGVNYFPITDPGDFVFDAERGFVLLRDRWRPFVGVSFNQRNFQSTTSQYAGIGVKGGAEYQYDERFGIHGTARYLLLSGPGQSNATQFDILTGLIVRF